MWKSVYMSKSICRPFQMSFKKDKKQEDRTKVTKDKAEEKENKTGNLSYTKA